MKHITTAVELEWFTEYVAWLHQLVWLHIVPPWRWLLGDTGKDGYILFLYHIYIFQSYKLSLYTNLKFVINTMRAAMESSLF